MKTIMVDDETWMLKQFEIQCSDIKDIQIEGTFKNPVKALAFAEKNPVELAFLDIEMPEMNGLSLAKRLKELYPEIIIIFISAYDKYMPEAFRNMEADYYVMKPYKKEDLEAVLDRARLLSGRLKKRIVIHTFGKFTVYADGVVVKFSSPKAKELFALLVDRGKTALGNEEAFNILWEDRNFNHETAVSYHKVVRRLKNTLEEAGIENVLIQIPRAHLLNVDIVDCDYYNVMKNDPQAIASFNGEYMTEYAWGEFTLGKIMEMTNYTKTK